MTIIPRKLELWWVGATDQMKETFVIINNHDVIESGEVANEVGSRQNVVSNHLSHMVDEGVVNVMNGVGRKRLYSTKYESLIEYMEDVRDGGN